MSDNVTIWKNFYKDATSRHNSYPSETLIRLLKGSWYLPDLDKNFKGRKALEIGFGSGNNLAFLASMGLDISGVEIEQTICDAAKAKFGEIGIDLDARAGHNREIPFEDNTFDMLVSWATVHYELNMDDYMAALREFRRVLKPGGWLLLETVAPGHSIFRGAKLEGPFIYRLTREDDIRCGNTFLCLENEQYVDHYYSQVFDDVVVGRIDLDIFRERITTFIVAGRKF